MLESLLKFKIIITQIDLNLINILVLFMKLNLQIYLKYIIYIFYYLFDYFCFGIYLNDHIY